MAAEVSLRVFILSIFLASAAAAQNRVAVLPVQPRSGADPDELAHTGPGCVVDGQRRRRLGADPQYVAGRQR